MRKILSLLAVSFLISCGSSRVITTKDDRYQKPKNENETVVEVEKEKKNNEKVTEVAQDKNTVNNNTSNTNGLSKVELYIQKYNAIAVKEMNSHGVPASITLAQGILESGAGEGDLTKRANNHFGIKCHDWKGERVYHDDDKKGECFRKYDDPAESFKDHSLFLSKRKRYAKLFDLKITDYKGWAKGLKAAGYATDPKYPNKLISLIERYHLDKYDTGNLIKSDDVEVIKEKVEVVEEIAVKEIKEEKEDVIQNNTTYKVKKGDTLYSISKSLGLTVEKLMELNNLQSAVISVDQILKIK